MERSLGRQNVLRNLAIVTCFWMGVLSSVSAQQTTHTEAAGPLHSQPESRDVEPVVLRHDIVINGNKLSYTTTSAMIGVKHRSSGTSANLFYVAYARNDVPDSVRRPISFLYNGGPGSSSSYLHMCAFGPRRIITVNADATGSPPYRLVDNANSLLEETDLVFIDPVGTGFSHALPQEKDKDFWGIDEDANSIEQFIVTYISQNNRWNSPRYLIGESYGAFRSVLLVNNLQSRGVMFNGVVLVSAILNMGKISFHPGEDLPFILNLPSYAAAAWFHNRLPTRPTSLEALLDQVRTFALTEYADALIKGSRLSPEETSLVATKLSSFTGLSKEFLEKANLRVTRNQFAKELLRDKQLLTGRLNARFSGPTADPLGEDAESDPFSSAIDGAVTSLVNSYFANELGIRQPIEYVLINHEVGRHWNWAEHTGAEFGFPGAANVEPELVHALVTNVALQVEFESGLYDIVTPSLEVEYTVDHLNLPRSLRGNIQIKYYASGHMMYLDEQQLGSLTKNITTFIEGSSRKGARPSVPK